MDSTFPWFPRPALSLLAASLALGGCGIWPDFDAKDAGIDAFGLLDGQGDAADRGVVDAHDAVAEADVSMPYGGFRTCTAPVATSTFAVTNVASVSNGVRDLAFDNMGHFYAAANDLNAFDMTGTATPITTSPALMGGTAVRFLSDGRLGVTTLVGSAATLSAINVGTGAVTVLNASSMLVAPASIAEHATGIHFVSDTGSNAVYRVSADGTTITSFFSMSELSPTGLALTPDGRHLFVASPSQAIIYRIDLNADATMASAGTSYASGFLTGQGMAFDQCGYLYVSDRDRARILRVPPNGGTPEQLSLSLPFETGAFAPSGVAFGQMGFNSSMLYVVDLGHSAVVAVDVGVPGAAIVTP